MLLPECGNFNNLRSVNPKLFSSRMKNAWHRFKRSFFSYNRSDRNAIVILAGIILALLTIQALLPHLMPKNDYDFTQFKKMLDAWESENTVKSSEQHSLFTFDPNTIEASSLDSLSLPQFVKRNIVSYREAGGKFVSADDLRKIYGMSDSIFELIQPYVIIEEPAKPSEPPVQYASNKTFDKKTEYKTPQNREIYTEVLDPEPFPTIELNRADSAGLVSLPGIGPVFAGRIIRYRQLLGGFYKKEQLLEVYNFPPETFSSIRDRVNVDSLYLTQLRINFLDYAELLRHPYLNKDQVNALTQQRTKEGPFKNLSEVAALQAFDSETFERVRPYLTCR